MATKRKSNDDTENSKEGVRRSTRIKKSVPLEEPLDADVQQKGSGQGRSRKTKAKDPNESNEASMKRRKTSQPNAKSTKAKPAATNSSSVSKDIVEDAKGSSGGDTIRTGHSYWLMKAEPDSRMEKGVDVKFSIDDLEACTEPEPWTGVRNHVAKNNMIAMKKGDLAFFYHSNTKLPGIAGILEIVHESSVDGMLFYLGITSETYCRLCTRYGYMSYLRHLKVLIHVQSPHLTVNTLTMTQSQIERNHDGSTYMSGSSRSFLALSP